MEVDRWPRSLPLDVVDLIDELAGLPLAAILLRATDREGRLDGPDLRMIEDVTQHAETAILVSGGIGTVGHLRNIEERGAAGAVIGTALHTGALSLAAIAAEFSA